MHRKSPSIVFALLLLAISTPVQAQNLTAKRAAFNRLDKNNDGHLTVNETPQVETFKVADTNNDSIVTFEEFKNFSAGRTPRVNLKPNAPSTTIVHPSVTPDQLARFKRAAAYSKKTGGLSMLVIINNQILFEQYDQGFTPTSAYRLASGTKSFWGVLALVAQHEKLLTLDETVADTITEWQDDPRKSKITVRQLLNFTSGLDPATAALRGPTVSNKFEYAVNLKSKTAPGAQYKYGPAHLFSFGEFLSRKLKAANKNPDPLAYLHQKILDPIGLDVESWSRDVAGNPAMPFGAFLTARQWAKFGQLILHQGQHNNQQLIPKSTLPQAFQGTKANPRYGLNWWLPTKTPDGNFQIPKDTVSANGAGTQRLIVIPSQKMTIVRQAESTSFNNNIFLQLLLSD